MITYDGSVIEICTYILVAMIFFKEFEIFNFVKTKTKVLHSYRGKTVIVEDKDVLRIK